MLEGRDRLTRDEEGQGITQFRWRDMPMVGTPGLAARRGAIGSPRIRRFSPIRGPENFSPVAGRGRGRGGVLPAWYPRRPLNDITAVVRAIERRIGHQRDGDTPETESRVHQVNSMISPRPTLSSKIPMILLDITHKDDDDSCLTPEKKLLSIIDSVEKVVKEEFRKMKRTPSAKKAEREKRVRTLMSMR